GHDRERAAHARPHRLARGPRVRAAHVQPRGGRDRRGASRAGAVTGPPDLAAVELFEGLPSDERAHLARLMTPFDEPVGTALFREGDPSDGLYLVTSGALRVVRPGPHGMAVPLATLGPGAVVGELSLLGASARTATVLVARQAEGWRLDRRAFDVLLADLRPTAVALIRRLGLLAAERVRDRYETIAAHLGVTPTAGA